jgi:hypothetical protein
MPALQAGTWEANKISTDTESSTLARRGTDARAHDIQDGKDSGGDHTKRENLVKGELVTGNKERSHGNKEALN